MSRECGAQGSLWEGQRDGQSPRRACWGWPSEAEACAIPGCKVQNFPSALALLNSCPTVGNASLSLELFL